MTFLIDLIAGAPAPLLAVCVAVYAATVLHLVARDIERACGSGWRAVQRHRIERRAVW